MSLNPLPKVLSLVLVSLIYSGTIWGQEEKKPQPPVAEKKPYELKAHGQTRIDNYYWMRERENPSVVDWLEKENEYLASVMAPVQLLQKKLSQQIRERIKQNDETVPYPDRGFNWFARTKDGEQYPVIYRRALNAKSGSDEKSSAEELVLDQNELSKGKEYCMVGAYAASPDAKVFAWSVDYVGRLKFTIQFKNLETGKILADEILETTGNFVFAEDNQHIFYTRQDPETLRAFQVYRHKIGDAAEKDQLVYEEKDEQFNVMVGATKSREFVLIVSAQTLSTEYRLIDSMKPESEPQIFLTRERNHEYHIDHLNGRWVVRTNRDAPNFRLMESSLDGENKRSLNELVPHLPDVLIENFELLNDWLVVQERANGLNRIRYRKSGDEDFKTIDFGEPCYAALLAMTNEPNTNLLRYSFTSPKTPMSTIEFDLVSGEKKVLKQEEMLGGFDSANYVSERVWGVAEDGTRIPIGLLRHKNTPVDGTAPLLIYAYGSYGLSEDDAFSASILNLVDRGFVFATAHIRGGQEMGRSWYENGKLLKKKNTFTDFIDCTRFLIEQKYADPKRVYAQGGSAGGLLMGAISNMAPDLYHGIIADVPFVDVVTTMLDDSIPLTTGEYDEWGNPNESEYYQYMLSYSPYDNVQKMNYPNILVTTGLHDSQVQYWEPAKWVAKLRELKTDSNLLLLHTEMSAGHGGSSGRYDQYREVAMRQAFLLMLAGIKE